MDVYEYGANWTKLSILNVTMYTAKINFAAKRKFAKFAIYTLKTLSKPCYPTAREPQNQTPEGGDDT